MATRTISAAGGNYSSTSTWDEGAVPTAADDIVCRGDGTSGNLVIDTGATRAFRSADFTNYTGTVSGTGAVQMGTTTAGPSNVCLKLVAGMTWTHAAAITYVGTNATPQTLTMAGKALGATLAISGAGGTLKLLDAARCSTFTLTNGTFDINGQTLTITGTAGTVFTVTSNSNTRVLAFGTGGSLVCNGTNATGSVSVGATTTNFSVTGTGTVTMAGGGTFRGTNWSGTSNGIALTLTGGGSSATLAPGTGTSVGTFGSVSAVDKNITISGSITVGGTFSHTLPTSVARTLTLQAGETLGVTGSLTLTGRSGVLLSVVSSTGGSAATISKASGTPTMDYLSVQDIAASGGATFVANNSTSVSGNTGIAFPKTLVLGLATSTATPFSLLLQKQAALGLVAETDSTFGSAIAKQAVLSLVEEADSTLGLSASKLTLVLLGLVEEGVSADALTVTKALTLGLAEEQDSSLGLDLSKRLDLALATEDDTAAAVSLLRQIELGLAAETDSPVATLLQKVAALRQVLEADTARLLLTPGYGPHFTSVRLRLRARSTSMRLRARSASMRLRVVGDRVKVN